MVEDYVVSANFDERKDLPQLTDRSRLRDVRPKTGGSRAEAKNGPGTVLEDYQDLQSLAERDLSVHHHHLPPPPPPVGLALAPSLFAVGFMAFLILLNSLHTSLLLSLKHKHSLLGSLPQPLGRRKRFVSAETPPGRGWEGDGKGTQKS